MIYQIFPRQDVENVWNGSLIVDRDYVTDFLSIQGIKDLFKVTEKVNGKYLVDYSLLKNFCTDEGLIALKKLLKKKRELKYWTCFICQKQCSGNQIECGSCMNLCHKSCAGLPDDDAEVFEDFFCLPCTSDYRKK